MFQKLWGKLFAKLSKPPSILGLRRHPDLLSKVGRGWCPGEDSNLHDLSVTGT
jgi:hypothetical protein